ncbi:hypothetical protein SM007_36935 [Streptomyces avermitilis]|nr:hypothetical protein SM007_36935 [Streptomyces avermitilis]
MPKCTDGTWSDGKHFSGACSRHRSTRYWFMWQERRPGTPSGCGAPQPAAEEGGSCARDQRGGGDAGERGLGPGVMGGSGGGQRRPGGFGCRGGLEDEVADRFGVGDHGHVGGVDLHRV